MWIWFTILLIGACQLNLSVAEGEVDPANLNEEELADYLINELKKEYGSEWTKHAEAVSELLHRLAEKKEGEDFESTIKDSETNLKFHWKKFVHKVGHVAGQVAKGAAINIAGKAIAGALTG